MSMIVPTLEPLIVAETPDWIVVNKPAGWLTIPGRTAPGASRLQPVLLDWLRERFDQALVVHRIDRETSGVVLFARSEQSHRQANIWFQNHESKKTYLCLAQGKPSAPMMRINQPIEKAPSVTQLEVKEKFENGFLGQVRPLSGRRHQIRIHLSQQGHPILGDTRYGGATQVSAGNEILAVKRVALHAARLELPNGEAFSAELAADFASWLEIFRKERASARS